MSLFIVTFVHLTIIVIGSRNELKLDRQQSIELLSRSGAAADRRTVLKLSRQLDLASFIMRRTESNRRWRRGQRIEMRISWEAGDFDLRLWNSA